MDGVFHDTAAATLFSAAKMNKVSLFASPRMFCDIYCLEPGQEQRPHRHAGNDKVYHALTGTCRVTVGGEIKFACVDGPEFDGHLVDFKQLMSRQTAYMEDRCRLQNVLDGEKGGAE